MKVKKLMSKSDQNEIAKITGNSVRYMPALAHVFGSVNAAIVLSQFIYWNGMGHRYDGFFYKTVRELYYETGLTEDQQSTAINKLKRCGVIETKNAGIPNKRHFFVHMHEIKKMVTTWQKTADPELKKALHQIPEKQRTITKTTSLNHQETIYTDVRSKSSRQSITDDETFNRLFSHQIIDV